MAYLNNPDEILDVTIDLSQPEDALFSRLIEVVRVIVGGAWEHTPSDSIEVKTLAGGITNVLYLVHDKVNDLKVIARMYGLGTSDFIDRTSENMVFSKLSQISFGPIFYGLFQNGRLEGYLPAVALESDEMGETALFPSIAKAVAQLHTIEVQEIRMDRWMWAKIETFLRLAAGIEQCIIIVYVLRTGEGYVLTPNAPPDPLWLLLL